MVSSVARFDYGDFWEIVDNPEKFELLSYLIFCLQYPKAQFYKTPQTRDGKRDAEGLNGNQKLFLEAKFIEDPKSKKLSHKEVGSNINIAIYELADILWIFTNGQIQLDLLNFITTHNELQEAILYRPLKINTANRQQIAIRALRYSELDYTDKLGKLDFVGYKSLTSKQIKTRKQELAAIGTDLIGDIQRIKKDSFNQFFCSPIFRSLCNNELSNEEKLEIIYSLFQIETYYQSTLQNGFTESIKIPLGSKFNIAFKVTNFFLDNVAFSINLSSKGLIKFIQPRIAVGKCSVESTIDGASEKMIVVEAQVERLPFPDLTIAVCLDAFTVQIPIGKIEVQNLFFLAPFIGEKNNETLALYNEKIDRSFYHSKFFLGLITGEAGIGKSRLIQEVIDHSRIYNLKLFRSELVASEGRKTIVRDLLAFFVGVDPLSFYEASDLLMNRFIEDKYFSSLFSSFGEFEKFKESFNRIIEVGIDNIPFEEVENVAKFIAKILFRLGEKYLTMVVIEDLHHGDKQLFSFLSTLYNILKVQKSKIVFLLAARTEAKDFTPAFREFELMISSDPTYSITKTEVQQLSDTDSLSLIKELVVTESKFEKIIQERILKKTGNNPFNIIHTLLQLKNRGVIVEKKNDFEWHNLQRLEEENIHVEIERLFKDRFEFYFSLTAFQGKLATLLGIICLFEAKVSQEEVRIIWNEPALDEMIDFLSQERIVRISGQFIFFDHENIFQYVQSNLLAGMTEAGELIIKWIQRNKEENYRMGLLVRSLNICFVKHSQEFFFYSWQYFQQLLHEDDWKNIMHYGQMFIGKALLDSNSVSPIKKFEVIFQMAYVGSEYADIETSISQYEALELELKHLIKEPKSITSNDDLSCLILYVKSRLYRCDAIIMAGQYLKARTVLSGLIHEIEYFQKHNETHKQNTVLSQLFCWSINRLGITHRALGNPEMAVKLFQKSLRIAKKISHEYFTHHNYYDMAGCMVHLNKIEDAYKIHRKSLMPVLELPDQKNAKIRTQIRTGLFMLFLDYPQQAEVEFEAAIQIARERGHLWELTRGLINLGNLYFKEKRYESALETYKTSMHYVDVHRARAFYICLYNNLGFLYLFYYQQSGNVSFLEKSLAVIVKLIPYISDPGFITIENQNIFHSLAILNLFIYQESLNEHGKHKAKFEESFKKIDEASNNLLFIRELLNKPEFIKRFLVPMTDKISFYLIYMSFS